MDRKQNIFCLHNITKEHIQISLTSVNLVATEDWIDLMTGEELPKGITTLDFKPYQCVWLANKRKYLPY